MHFVRATIVSVIVGLAWAAQTAAAGGFDHTAYLSIGNLKGSSTAAGHEGWFVVLNQTFTPGKIVVYLPADSSDTSLQTAMSHGDHFDRAELDVVRPEKGEEKMVFVDAMQGVTIGGMTELHGSPNCAGAGDCFEVTLTYAKMSDTRS